MKRNTHTTTGAGLPRLAFNTEETAQMLGLERTSLWRLEKRGLIRANRALRTPLFPLAEINRFLNESAGMEAAK